MMKRLHQSVLIGSTIVASWFGMQAVHEGGHVLGAFVSGGAVQRIVLHPSTISRTDVAPNPNPLLVVWAGPIFGVLFPLSICGVASLFGMPGSFVCRFFAGFCMVANGAYIAFGSFDHVGDCGEMLRHGSSLWHLWLFGGIAIPLGFWLWHGQGRDYGFGTADGVVSRNVAYVTLAVALLIIVLGFTIGGE